MLNRTNVGLARAMMFCATLFDSPAKTGEVHWRKRFGGTYWASPFVAGAKVYYSSKQGKVTVVEASREFKQLAEHRFESGFAASPAAAGNALILRTETHLYCID